VNQSQPATDGVRGLWRSHGALPELPANVRGTLCVVKVKIRRNTTAERRRDQLTVLDRTTWLMTQPRSGGAPRGISNQSFDMGAMAVY